MSRETETIDKLFLELSQFATATTAKELTLKRRVEQLERKKASLERELAAARQLIRRS